MADRRPRILISNDDGVAAPGLTSLAKALNADGTIEFAVCGPFGERSAQSHCITIGKHLHAFEIEIEGATEAFAVDGTPADSVMLALQGPVLANPTFDLVVSGINRGDNCGLHVIYSGTVGAAREAACKGLPAIAFSLADHHARSEEQYAAAAVCAVTLIKSVLGLLPESESATRPLRSFAGHVINVNIPGVDLSEIRGFHITHQGHHCSFPDFQEVEADPHFATTNGGELQSGAVKVRAYRNAAGYLQSDNTLFSDSWAVNRKWVAVTVVGLKSDLPLTVAAAGAKVQVEVSQAVVAVSLAAAAHMKIKMGALPDGL